MNKGKVSRWNKFAAILSVVAASVTVHSASATDGTLLSGGNWSTASIWKDHVIAADGGQVTGAFSSAANLTVDQAGTTVGGITWPAYDLSILGNPLYFTGNAEIFSGSTLWLKNTSLDGQGTASLRYFGTGALYIDSYSTVFTNFVSVTHSSGGPMRSYKGSPFLTSGTFVFNNGTATFQSQASAGTAVTADFANGKDAKVVVRRGNNVLNAAQNNADSLVFRTGAFDIEEGGTLKLGLTSGKTLGTDTKVIPAAAPACDGTLVTPALVRSSLDLLTYDAADGFKVFDGYVTDLASATANDVVKLAATAALGESKTVKSLVLDNSAGITFSNDAILTLGDGTNPAALVLLRPSYAAVTISGSGAIDFGASPAYVWIGGGTGSGNRQISFNSPLKGTGPVAFGNNNSTVMLNFNVANPDLKGPIYFNLAGGRIYSGVNGKRGDPFPNVSDIYLTGGQYASVGPQLYGFACVTQHLHVAGYGNPNGGDQSGVIHDAASTSVIDGPVTLEAPSEFHSQGGTLTFNGPIDGRGKLRLYGNTTSSYAGTIALNGESSYAGETDVCVKNLNISGSSPFGTGRVTVNAVTTVKPTADVTVANDISCAGTIDIPAGVRANFSGDAEVASVTVDRTATLGVGTRFAPTALTAPYGATIAAAKADAVLELDTDGADKTLTATMTGDVKLQKSGAGTLTIAAAQTHTGGTLVDEGTVQLANSISRPPENGLTMWLDASDGTTFTTNEAGVVSQWRSRVGSVTMNPADASRFGKPTLTTGWNGLPAVRFDGDATNKLTASAAFKVRTLFFVFRSTKYLVHAGLWGYGGDNYGIRMGGNETAGTWSVSTSGNWCFMDVNPYIDGVNTSAFSFGEPHVMRSVRQAGAITSPGMNLWCLGSYVSDAYDKTGSGRPWTGDLAEVLAYDRTLSEEESRLVENYLAAKWQQKSIYDIAVPLAATAEVSVGAKGTLDVNGLDLTLASLDGEGTIVNSADTNVTLTVTDAVTFRGRVSGKMTLKTPAGADVRVRLTDGAALAATGGTIGGYAPDIPSEGIAYWLDAARAETVHCAADGETVTNWSSRIGSTFAGPRSDRVKPTYEPTGMDGKPALYFGATNGWTALELNVATNLGTVFVVYRADGATQTSSAGILGVYGTGDGGIRMPSANMVQWVQGSSAFAETDYATLDGVSVWRPATQTTANHSETHVLSVRRATTPLSKRSCILGGYYYVYQRVMKGWIAEVIVYDRVLTEAEEAQVNDYLNVKWRTAGALDSKYGANILGGTLQVDVVDGAIPGESVPTAVDAPDLSQTTLFVNGLKTLGKASTWTFLKGETVGDFLSTNVTDPWKVRRRGTGADQTWTLHRARGFVLLFR